VEDGADDRQLHEVLFAGCRERDISRGGNLDVMTVSDVVHGDKLIEQEVGVVGVCRHRLSITKPGQTHPGGVRSGCHA
jgi:hypothetical protein